MSEATPMKQVMAFFEMSIGEFRKEWKELTDEDKAEIRKGIVDGTLTY